MLKQTLTDSNWTLLDLNLWYAKIAIKTDNAWVQMSRKLIPASDEIIDMVVWNYYIFDFSESSNPSNVYVKGANLDVIDILNDVEAIQWAIDAGMASDISAIKTAVESIDADTTTIASDTT